MFEQTQDNSSSSEDEVCLESLKEAADQNFLKECFFNKKSTGNKNKVICHIFSFRSK